ncbi:MAG: DUF2200 domain-containing protein [Planctomycetota bacterium]
MSTARVFDYPFATIYPLYLQKVARKGRTAQELDAALGWLTGYDAAGLQRQVDAQVDLRGFFAAAPALHPDRERITGVVCGVRVEAIDDPLLRLIRQMDKLVDELAKGKPLAKVLRA